MADVNCKVEIPEVKDLEANQMTVGRHQILACEGDWDKTFDFSKAFVKLEKPQKNIVKIFKAEARTPNSFDVDLTVYTAGTFQFQDFVLSDGTIDISLGPKKFEVISVIEKPADGKPPQPFGPVLPLQLAWPPIYFILLILIIGAAIGFAIYSIRRRARLKTLLDSLRAHDSSLDPDLQFYKSMRVHEKNGYPVEAMEESFKLFILRIYQVPFFQLSRGQSLRFMKKRRRQFSKHRTAVQKFLEEFEELRKNPAAVKLEDRQQLAKRLYRFVDLQAKATE